jgi:hypothetical protein
LYYQLQLAGPILLENVGNKLGFTVAVRLQDFAAQADGPLWICCVPSLNYTPMFDCGDQQ